MSYDAFYEDVKYYKELLNRLVSITETDFQEEKESLQGEKRIAIYIDNKPVFSNYKIANWVSDETIIANNFNELAWFVYGRLATKNEWDYRNIYLSWNKCLLLLIYMYSVNNNFFRNYANIAPLKEKINRGIEEELEEEDWEFKRKLKELLEDLNSQEESSKFQRARIFAALEEFNR